MNITARGVLFDLDGTLYEAGRLIDGAREAVEFCERSGIPYRFATNTTSKPRSAVVRHLQDLGLTVRPDWIFTAPAAAGEILRQRGFVRCHLLLRDSLRADLPGTENVAASPQAVVVGDLGGGFSYEALNRAFRLLLDENCAFLTLARNRYFQTAEGLTLDVGAFTAALEYATGRKAELIGKPAPAFFQAAAQSMGLELRDIAMIGDDLESDALGAIAAGLQGVLVRTGKFRADQLERAPTQPGAIWESVAELPSRLRTS